MRFNLISNRFEEENISPEKIAVAGSDSDLTWAMLRLISEKFRSVFEELNIPKGHPVMIYGHKEHVFIPAMLGAIISDIPYIPVDSAIPSERVRRIRDITGSQVMIICGEKRPEFRCAVEILPDLTWEVNGPPNWTGSVYWREKDPIRYVIFTSGSTGEPKGVQITREAIGSFIDWMDRDYGFSCNEVFVNQAPFSFDLSVYEVMFTLHLGASIILNSSQVAKSSPDFIERIRRYRSTVWVSTPSFAYLYLMESTFNKKVLPSLRTFLFCGEELPCRTARKLLDLFPDSRVLNTYGPTEATVSTTLVNITKEITEQHPILPVGYPKYSCEIRIENKEDDPSQPGEIVIIGDNVSIGYINNKEMSLHKFFIHNGRRAYRTGDHGYLREGMLFFLGRQDDQVKLNGYRIELGDIESKIAGLKFVEDAVAIPLKHGNTVKRIVSFVKLKEDARADVTPEYILHLLKPLLPEYMIPGDIRFVKNFPYNNNHKIDKRELANWYVENRTLPR